MWSMYVEHTLKEDKETVEAWNDDLDSILIFAALFSAVVTTFVVESSHNLKVDDSAELLRAVLLEMKAARNASGLNSGPPVPAAFTVTGSALRVNAYWFSSLVISLATALITILAKQWVNYLLAGLSPVPSIGARHRQYRIDGMHKWKLPTVISILPIFLHISLLLFFAGLVEFVWDLNMVVGTITAALVATTSVVYFAANIVAYIYPECPYKTSMAVFIGQVLSLMVAIYGKALVAFGVAWDLVRAAYASPSSRSTIFLTSI
ncbi:hypothetical protein K466DRAFT_488296 [Polyporus arcularius HHB13444]|uniref:DUF6535 domain-containing protein n=1 Tax=Polyporus arcularius HHB13444 TaxID=1314778 RepID=A0A5C3PIR6_9APHY|nr:hypothetical protein K466DRAFT_488296 [Polyporus arcularius HHB13444]